MQQMHLLKDGKKPLMEQRWQRNNNNKIIYADAATGQD
jgi:predicted nucleic acid-binding protein